MNDIPAIVRRSIGDACTSAGPLLERCVNRAVAELQLAEEAATALGGDRRAVAEAWRALQQQRASWVSRFPLLLRTACEAAAAGADAAESGPITMRPSSLTLVEDEQVAQTILCSRLVQKLATSLERPLSELDSLMSAALDLPGVQPERNPLRPQEWAQTLVKLVAEAAGSPSWAPLWIRHLGEPLAEELAKLYKDQVHLLTVSQVRAASYRVLNTPGRTGQTGFGTTGFGNTGFGNTGFGAPGNSAPMPLGQTGQAPLGRGSVENLRSWSSFAALGGEDLQAGGVLHDFLFNGAARAQVPLTEEFYAGAREELRAIDAAPPEPRYDAQAAQAHAHLPAVDRPAREIRVASPLPSVWGRFGEARQRALLRTRLKTDATEVGQVLGLEVVRKLVDQVAQDPRLLAPVREAIVALEPSLLRLAMVAPRFFSEDDHPGRRLVERVAERSFRYNDEFSVEFRAFYTRVVESFRALNALEALPDATPFRDCLSGFEAAWAAQDQLDAQQQKPALDAFHFAEQRQEQAGRIAWELGQRSDLAGVPEVVQEFLFGPWALVMAHARLVDQRGLPDPGGYVAVVTDLVWSVKKEQALREPARAFELIPRVLLTLRRGLGVIGHPATASEPFFAHLEALHLPVMKLRMRQRKQTGLDTLQPLEPLKPVAVPRDADEGVDLFIGERERVAAGFDTGPAPIETRAASRAPAAPLLDEPTVERVFAGLVQGCWVDLHVHQQWRRAKLLWASARSSLFMFVSDGGMPHSMTRRSLEKLIRERHLRPVDAEAVVPRALRKLTTRKPERVLEAA